MASNSSHRLITIDYPAISPWKQVTLFSGPMMWKRDMDAFETRPLTLTSFVKGIGRNFLVMSFWRTCWTLRGLGFMKTEEACYYRWSDLTLRFWRYQQIGRFAWGRRLRKKRQARRVP